MSARETSLQALRNVVMARKNLRTVWLCFFHHTRNLSPHLHEEFVQKLTDLTKDYFNDFNANNQSTANEAKTVHFLRRVPDLTQAAPPQDFKKTFAEPINRTMASCHGCVILTHPDKFELEKDVQPIDHLLGSLGERGNLWAAIREENYVHREASQYLQMYAPVRKHGGDAPLVAILPVNKTQDWWNMNMLHRHALLYPSFDEEGNLLQRRHFHLGAEHIKVIFRKLMHSTVGYQRDNAFDFLTYFEMAGEKASLFMDLLNALRDPAQNPEWRYAREGTLFFGRRVKTPEDLLQR